MDDQPGRHRIVTGHQRDEDEMNFALRPRTLEEYDVGQRQLIDNLRISIDAARQRQDVLEHLLLHGPPGLGKTTLAHIIAREMESELHRSSGPALERPSDLVGILTNLSRGDVLFIDEIHRLPRIVEEYLYSAMEDFRIDFVVDSGPYAKSIPLHLEPFTLVGATTRAGLLTGPMRERFGIFHHIDFYTPEQLEKIAARAASLLEIDMTSDGCRELATRARGTARIVCRLLRRVRDYAQIKGDGSITREIAHEALDAMGVDATGLDDLDRKYLQTLISYYDGGPAGLNALAATLAEDEGTLEEVVEPYLLKIGFVIRTSRGRQATPAAYEHLKLEVPKASGASAPELPFESS
jgi:Holliday junction DNA helicase RuvB